MNEFQTELVYCCRSPTTFMAMIPSSEIWGDSLSHLSYVYICQGDTTPFLRRHCRIKLHTHSVGFHIDQRRRKRMVY